MLKPVTVFAVLMAGVTGVAVMQLNATVQQKTKDVRSLVQQINHDREAIRVLEAEWGYQASPKKLQENSLRFLALMPPQASQLVTSIDEIPFRPKGRGVEPDDGVLLPTVYDAERKEYKTKEDKKRTNKGQGL